MSFVCGFLSLDKPAGWSSREAVNRVQRLVRPNKVGHAGTLDPLATGVLVVAVGPATRLIDEVQAQSKTYRGSFRFGVESVSEDIESPLTTRDDLPIPTREAIEAVLPRFLGRQMQRPPAFSALKVQGERAYTLARRGETPELAPREIDVEELRVEAYEPPDVTLFIRCGSGTYVRSLGRDIALALGSVATMTALRRLAVGGFLAEESVSPETLDAEGLAAAMRSPSLGLPDVPVLKAGDEEANHLLQGRAVDWVDATPPRFFIEAKDGRCVALCRSIGSGQIRAERILLPQDAFRR
ncbi:MAG TPA: tRNA pseudouridine(55) synthase TruB [Pirellulaceae bacterium]|jgi:tRNA pseudouridine55 synthase|nr:tRNA pseudouridine(55) synthase TruB [Pirellulaceae bacterium]